MKDWRDSNGEYPTRKILPIVSASPLKPSNEAVTEWLNIWDLKQVVRNGTPVVGQGFLKDLKNEKKLF